ncbi:12850_t:CDS:1 [Funneliformis geosporum]|uniref:12167_t:CDS:1 n=1 Tax=Funneliformis geosporum TaxID=1117311 RepID=A0A9W4SCN6_9GLOM|nr:12167_t:CDS:1 [Funneliformis geosporum]CAI2193135.1 12850_t:CDS:1 [Funneliformis geosporum]
MKSLTFLFILIQFILVELLNAQSNIPSATSSGIQTNTRPSLTSAPSVSNKLSTPFPVFSELPANNDNKRVIIGSIVGGLIGTFGLIMGSLFICVKYQKSENNDMSPNEIILPIPGSDERENGLSQVISTP